MILEGSTYSKDAVVFRRLASIKASKGVSAEYFDGASLFAGGPSGIALHSWSFLATKDGLPSTNHNRPLKKLCPLSNSYEKLLPKCL